MEILNETEIKEGLFAPAGEDEETAEIYRREARSVYEYDKESAAYHLLDSAYANDHDEVDIEDVIRDLQLAVSLCPESTWVYETAHRLMLKLGFWQETLNLIEHEFDLVSDLDYSLAAAVTISDLHWIVDEDPNSAMEWIRKALSLDGEHIEALYSGLWMSLSAREVTGVLAMDEAAAEKYAETLARIVGAPGERAVLYGMAGSILCAQNNETHALECYGLAVQSDRNNPYVLLRYALLCEKFGKLQDAAQSYAQVAQIFDDGSLCSTFYRRAAAIYSYIGQPERSSFYFGEALKTSTDKFGIVWMAIDSFRRTGNFQRVVELERQLVDMAPDDETKAAHYMSMSDTYLEEIGATDEAIAALEAAGSMRVGFAADERLAALYEARGDWKNLARVLERLVKISTIEVPVYQWLRADALWKSGEKSSAIEVLSGITTGLGRFRLDLDYEETGQDEQHARLLDAWMRSTEDDATRQALLSQIISILTERLNSPEIAVQYLKDEMATKPTRDLAWKRIHLNAKLYKFETVVEGLIQIAEETVNPTEARIWLLEAALIYDKELKRPDEAIKLLTLIHEKAPNEIAAVILLHSIALREKRYGLLLQVNAWREGFQVSSGIRSETCCENAWACLKMGDDNNAVAWFEKARRFAALSAYSMKQYIDLLCRLERWEELVRVVDDALVLSERPPKDPNEHDPFEEPLEPLDDVSNAIREEDELVPSPIINAVELSLAKERRIWREIMFDIQSHCLRHPMGTVHARQQHFERNVCVETLSEYLIEKMVLEPLETIAPVLADSRAKLGGTSEEIQALMDWIQAELMRMEAPNGATPKNAAYIESLLRRSLSYSYGPCLRAEILWCIREIPNEDIISWLDTYAELTPDRWIGLALSREAALRAIWVEENYEAARRAISRGLIKEDTDRRTLWMLEHFSAISEDWQALGFFREKLAQLEISTVARVQAFKSALSPYIDADLTEHAVRVAQECLKLNAHAYPALLTLAHVAEDAEDEYSLAGIADRLSEASSCPDNRISYGLWAASIWSKNLDRQDQAILSLGRLLAHDPTCMSAIAMSEQLHIQQEKYDLLSRIYVRAISALPEGEDQVGLLRKQAKLLAEKLDDAPAACLALSRIIKQIPDDIEALEMLSDLLMTQERWAEAVDILEQLSKVVEDPTRRRETSLKLAKILVNELERPEHARRILRRHLMQFENDMPALQLLYAIACSERNWNDAKLTLEEICKAKDTEEARHARMAFTRIGREAGWSHEMRSLYEREAIDAVIDFRSDFDELVEDYKKHGELNRLIDVAKRELDKQGTAEMIAKYRGCVAALLVANSQHKDALVFLSEVIQEKHNTDWAYLARAQALTSAGQLASAVGEFRRTLTRNIHLNDAFEPFIEVLKQIGDNISLAAASALYETRLTGTLSEVENDSWTRCIKGQPRGFFDIELLTLNRAYYEALRYLRNHLVPYVYNMFSDGITVKELDVSHWAFARCHRLFGQNMEIRRAFSAKGLKRVKCKIRLGEELALIFDESILDQSKMVVFDFWAAYAMHQYISGGALIDDLEDSDVEALFCALCQVKPESSRAQEMKKALYKFLPRAERKAFKDGVPFISPSWPDFRTVLQNRAACIGAIVCASPAYAITARPNNEELEKFLISESYVRFVQMYWT